METARPWADFDCAQTEGPRSDSRCHRVGLVLHRTEFFGRSAFLPGPASVLSAERLCCHKQLDRRLIATVPPRSLTQWGGLAVSRLDGRGVSLSRVLFLGS